jgi:hypothetical protein
MTGGPHGDLGVAGAVPGHFPEAKPEVERLRAAVDREHVENQVVAFLLRFVKKCADEPCADAAALMVRVDLDAGQVDLARAVIDIQHADIVLPAGDDLPSVHVEGARMKRALDLVADRSVTADLAKPARDVPPGHSPDVVPRPAAGCDDDYGFSA